jgi:hypothetical protein
MSNHTDLDFKPISCQKCGNLIWAGVSASSRCDIKLDTARLNLVEEVLALTAGLATYEIHRTAQSFEATRRTATRMKAAAPIVLATHTCRALTVFAEQPPDYFGSTREPLGTISEKVPF